MITRRSASLAVHGELKRGHINAALKTPLHCGGEAPAPGPEFFTAQVLFKREERPAAAGKQLAAFLATTLSGGLPILKRKPCVGS